MTWSKDKKKVVGEIVHNEFKHRYLKMLQKNKEIIDALNREEISKEEALKLQDENISELFGLTH